MHFEPVRRRSVYELIVQRIEEMMLQRELGPGDRLPPDRELARLFGVSRTSVRQALAVLQQKGLVAARVGDGTYATPEGLAVTDLAGRLDAMRDRAIEPIEVRRLIEPGIARLAAERASGADVAELGRLLQVQRERVRAGRSFVDEDTAFHRLIAVAANNTMLLSVVDSCWKMLRASRELSLSTTEGARLSLEGHRRIHEAIAGHDPDLAHEAMFRHIEVVSTLILSLQR